MKKQIKIKEKSLNVCLTASCGCYKKRATTDRGLTLWQLNRFMKRTGYRIQRQYGRDTNTNFVMCPVNKSYPKLKYPSFNTNILRRYDGKALLYWTKRINTKLKTVRVKQ